MILFLVLAFAKPFERGYLSGAGEGVRSTILLVLDDSFSMEARSDSGTVFDEAKKKLIQTLSILNDKDEIYFTTTSKLGRENGKIFYDNKDALIDSVNHCKISPATHDLDYILYFSDKILSSSSNTFKEFFLYTDGQKSTFVNTNGSPVKIDNSENTKHNIVLCGKNPANNISIDTINITSKIFQKNKPIKLKATVTNHNNFDTKDVSLNLILEGTKKTPFEKTVDIQANSSVDMEFSFTPESTGFGGGFIELTSSSSSGITKDDEIVSDNKRYFSYKIPDKIKILAVSGIDKDLDYIKLALTSSEDLSKDSTGSKSLYFEIKHINENELLNWMDNTKDKNDCILIINKKSFSQQEADKLFDYVQNGGGLLLYPGDNTDINNYNSILFKKFDLFGIDGTFGSKNGNEVFKFDKVDLDHPVFEGIFKVREEDQTTILKESPSVKSGFNLIGGINAIPLIKLNNERNFLVEYTSGKGRILFYSVASDMNYSDFPSKNIFPPITIRSILYLANINTLKESIAGSDYFIDLSNERIKDKDTLLLTPLNETKNITRIPVYNKQDIINLKDETNYLSNYSLSNTGNAILEFPCNFDKRETIPDKLNETGLAGLFEKNYKIKANIITPGKEFITSLQQVRSGRELWKYFLIIAVIFLLLELIISKLILKKPEVANIS